MASSIRTRRNRVARRARGALSIAIGVAVASSVLHRPVLAQRQTDPAALQRLSQQFRDRLLARRTPLYYALLRSTDPAQQALNRDPNIQLMFIREGGMPAYYLASNIDAARTVRTFDVWPLPVGGGFHGLTGASTPPGALAVWDAGGVLTLHQEFGGRVTQMDAPGGTHYHATHVAGIMVAGGVDPNARGMSYEAALHAFDWNNDKGEMAAAAASGLQVSNHSYGYAAGWRGQYWYGDLFISTVEDYGFGYYDAEAEAFDQISFNAPEYLICVAAGNDRNDVPWVGTHFHWDGVTWVGATDVHGADGQHGGYDTISYLGNAKNILTVGAVEDIPGGYSMPSDVVQAPFSSWGPTDDGRIKPDIVANGMALYSTIDASATSYATYSGTSMSTPNASGSINLIAREYEKRFGKKPWASALKAAVINTADEAGPADGPDYANGWGLLNTRRAIELISMGWNEAGGILERTLNMGEVHEYSFSIDSLQDVRVTIVWTDPPGTPPTPALDPPAKMLVHDLDLRMTHVGSGLTYEPWTLDGANPSLAATPGDNVCDNVEQIDLAGAPLGDYTVTVTHKNGLTEPSQDYALVWRGMRNVNATPVADGPGAVPAFALAAPYPNPVAGWATIDFSLDRAETVTIGVYDVQGRRVAVLIDRAPRAAGPGSARLDTKDLRSGVYFVKMQTPTRSISRKITVVR